MQKKHYFHVLAMTGALTTAVLTGCVDENYNLDDIDTTMQFQVNNLTLPLNLAPVKLEDLVDLTSEEDIDTINGEYVLLKEGQFTSDKMEIATIIAKPTIEGNTRTQYEISKIVGGLAIDIKQAISQFRYNYDDVDEYIVDIESGKIEVTLSLVISVIHENGSGLPGQFSDLKVVFPKGLYGTVNGTYVINKETGNELTIESANVGSNGIYRLDFDVTTFDFAASGATLENHNFELKSNIGIMSGQFAAANSQSGKADLTIATEISDLQVNSVTGTIFYDVDELKINENISLSDLPDVLADKRTKISLRNPQLYLSINNPLGKIGLTASSGFELSQIRPAGEAIQTAYLPDRLQIAGVEGAQTYCLCPDTAALKQFYPKYPSAKLYQLNNFGNIVYGDGLPDALKVDFSNPMINKQFVADFPLGVDLGQISGDYTLYAPLDLGENSVIYYEDEAKDWGLSSDSDDMNISLLVVDADVTSNLPIGVELTVKPLNKDGNVIPGVKVTPVEIPAASTKHVEIKVEGTILDLDGMRYTAIIKSAADAKALSPESSLTLNNLKIRVTGNYIIRDTDDDDK